MSERLMRSPGDYRPEHVRSIVRSRASDGVVFGAIGGSIASEAQTLSGRLIGAGLVALGFVLARSAGLEAERPGQTQEIAHTMCSRARDIFRHPK